jgi:nucleoside-diphosphate-sugar epimerase
MHYLILGATSPSGICIIEHALSHSHSLKLYVRTPSKVPAHISAHKDVTIVTGQIHDEESIENVVQGVDGIISALGPVFGQPSDKPITRAYELLLNAMKKYGIKRLTMLGTLAIQSPHDHFSAIRSELALGVYTLAHSMYIDVVAFGELMKSGAGKGLEISIMRIPVLNNFKGSGVPKIGYVGSKGVGWTLARNDLGIAFVDEAEKGEFVGEAVLVSS